MHAFDWRSRHHRSPGWLASHLTHIKRENAQREFERRVVAQLNSCLDGWFGFWYFLCLELLSQLILNIISIFPLGVQVLLSDLREDGSAVFVVATSSRPESIDPSLRRAGRLEREVSIVWWRVHTTCISMDITSLAGHSLPFHLWISDN